MCPQAFVSHPLLFLLTELCSIERNIMLKRLYAFFARSIEKKKIHYILFHIVFSKIEQSGVLTTLQP